jgi:hypothetical protein
MVIPTANLLNQLMLVQVLSFVMSDSISKIKAEIKEWQRAYRRVHGRDPGKDELRKNPEMRKLLIQCSSVSLHIGVHLFI